MANQAIVQRGGGGEGAPPPSPFLPAVGNPPAVSAAPPGPALFATDLLPQSALTDPAYISGTGSTFAISQPALAAKHGVIRNGVLIPPQALQEGRRGLSQQTIEGIQALNAAQANAAQRATEADTRAFDESAKSSAGAAARLASPSANPDVRPAAGSGDVEVEDAIRKMDDFDFGQLREMMTRDLLNNEEQRAIVEKAVTPLDLSELITKGHVEQVVPIIPGRFYPTFRSLSAGDDLALKRMIMEESGEIEVNSRYLIDKFALMSVAASTYAINNNPLPEYWDSRGTFDRALFLKKFEFILKQPFHMIAALSIHSFWFDIRVRKLFVAEKLGNG